MLRLRVLDLSRVLAGPLCSMILGDLGADVIKVERPLTGDDTRGWGPPFGQEDQSAYFLAVNRNKKSIAADLGDVADLRLIKDLIAGADVVLDNFLPGSLSKIGLEPESLLEAHPSLIWCTISGFGDASDRPGYDFVVQAESGWMAITGSADGPPMKVGVALADVVAGEDAVIAILAAISERSEGRLPKERRRIHVSLTASARASLVNVAQNVLVSGKDAERWGNAHPNLVPYQLFDARDRPIVIAVGSDTQWLACARALDLEKLATEKVLMTNAGRTTNRDKIVAAIAERLLENDARYWLDRLESGGVPCGVVKGVKEALESSGASPVTGVPPSVPGWVRLSPPKLDEHGNSIRRSGWGAFERDPI
ncbi:MAG: CaiB/BaiF CoA transferase family protein [Gemmatimonadaceae bacterium]